jgi:hypothetical protein
MLRRADDRDEALIFGGYSPAPSPLRSFD